MNLVAGGWDVGLLGLAQTGFPFALNSPVDTFGGGNGTRINYPGGRIGEVQVTGNGPRYFTPEQSRLFQIPAPSELGSISRNMFHRPMLWNMDASLVKRVPITEGQSVVLRLEAYNPLNAVVFGNLHRPACPADLRPLHHHRQLSAQRPDRRSLRVLVSAGPLGAGSMQVRN